MFRRKIRTGLSLVRQARTGLSLTTHLCSRYTSRPEGETAEMICILYVLSPKSTSTFLQHLSLPERTNVWSAVPWHEYVRLWANTRWQPEGTRARGRFLYSDVVIPTVTAGKGILELFLHLKIVELRKRIESQSRGKVKLIVYLKPMLLSLNISACMYVCVCVCVRARACVCVW